MGEEFGLQVQVESPERRLSLGQVCAEMAPGPSSPYGSYIVPTNRRQLEASKSLEGRDQDWSLSVLAAVEGQLTGW